MQIYKTNIDYAIVAQELDNVTLMEQIRHCYRLYLLLTQQTEEPVQPHEELFYNHYNLHNGMWDVKNMLSKCFGEYCYRWGYPQLQLLKEYQNYGHTWKPHAGFLILQNINFSNFQVLVYINDTTLIEKTGVLFAYRQLFQDKWLKAKTKPKWTKRKPPQWYQKKEK